MDDARLTGAIELPDGAWVRGRGLREGVPDGAVPEFGLYLGTGRLRHKYGGQLSWPARWVSWPDFLLPLSTERAVAAIRDLHGRAVAGERVEVACGGGVGRTGTVIACLAILAGHPAEDAVAWVRANYRHGAVETPWQRWWITRFSQVSQKSDRKGG